MARSFDAVACPVSCLPSDGSEPPLDFELRHHRSNGGSPPTSVWQGAMTPIPELFTTAASGASHVYHRNIDGHLVWRLAPAGMVGARRERYCLPTWMALQSHRMSLPISRSWVATSSSRHFGRLAAGGPRLDRAFAGLGGGVLDAAGGGGWGPIVTGSLIGRGHEPRRVIGSTNLTEFLLTATISATFFFFALGWSELRSAIGLIIGGVLAEPLSGYLVAPIPSDPLCSLWAS